MCAMARPWGGGPERGVPRSRRHRPEAGVVIDRDRYHGRVTDPGAGASWQFVPPAAWRRGSPRRFGPVAWWLAAATVVSLSAAVAVWWVAPVRSGLGGGSVRYFAVRPRSWWTRRLWHVARSAPRCARMRWSPP